MLAENPQDKLLRQHQPSQPVDPSMCAFVHQNIVATDVLHVFGEIDLSNVDEFLKVLGTLDPAAAGVVDMGGCTYIDSAGLRALGKAYMAREGRLRVVVASKGPVRRIFDITGLSTQLQIRATVEDALAL